MKKPLVVSFILLTALFTCGHVLAQTQQQAIPSTFFGIHVDNPTIDGESSYPVGVNYGEFRSWDVYQVSWPDIETCEATTSSPDDTCFGSGRNAENFQALQTELVALHNATPSVDNVMITLSRTPWWAVRNATGDDQATDTNCNYYDPVDTAHHHYGGACYAPNGIEGENHLATDGTGDDTIWINWVAAIANYVNNSSQTWCGSNCAHVKYWEIWNEFNRNNINASSLGPDDPHSLVSWYASTDPTYGCQVLGYAPCPTPDQLIRMTEDALCVITGTGTVDNYMSAGHTHTCLDLEQNHGYPGPFDTTAQIVQPSITDPKATDALQCYLYCNATACGHWYGTSCVNTNGWAHSSQSVDVINFHDYVLQSNPEDHSTTLLRDALNHTEKIKPLWMGEGSWGNSLTELWRDPYVQGGIAARYFAIEWQNSTPLASPNNCAWNPPTTVCQQVFWYGYDYDTTTVNNQDYRTGEIGALDCAGMTPHGSCANGGQQGNGQGLIPIVSQMYSQAVSWLTNATPDSTGTNPFCNAVDPQHPDTTTWYCDFTVNSTQHRMVWNTTNSAAAEKQTNYCATNFPNSPYVCGSTNYTVPVQYTHWQDLSGANHTLNDVVPFQVGLNPVLLKP